MPNDRRLRPGSVVVIVAIAAVTVSLPRLALGTPPTVGGGVTPPPTFAHEWTLALVGALFGSFFGPVAEWVDNKCWSWFPVARIRRDQKAFQADTSTRLNTLEAKLDDVAELLRQLHAARPAETSQGIATAAAEIATPANDATPPPTTA